MKMDDALAIIDSGNGFLVTFEVVAGGGLLSDHFPDIREGEEPIASEDEAWALAKAFAKKTYGKCVNIYVIHSENFAPVKGYDSKKIVNR